MTKVICALAIAFAMPVFANELDQERTTPSAEQLKLANDLPQTVIVRVSKTDPNQVEVVQVKEKVPAGKKLENLKFSKVALNAENAGLPVTSENELDATSSTSSWSFGFYNWNTGRGLYAHGGYPYYGYGRSWGWNNNWGWNGGWNNYYYPTIAYGGYNYGYTPYWGYSDPYYNYAYCATTAYWY